ncbi:DUF58 domain-containing protein [Sporosarcina limicola]|uniref:Uncharacterized protein (DUF58 family) n=1 Tax=Sporosarcina limicola TaxID=34101 RepID=A0A927MI75_9BACL|nr:DUF58 domain-containing protein [Sporosarcina limicola]MBE1553627.1 uncharacterized protein (DUF58 family) [Sporosarcina limicola]
MTGQLFPDRLTKRLGTLSILSRSGRLGHHKGTHRSRKTGASLDFSDFREYHPGDDLRHIDWNVYARTDKPFIKQFLDEQEMRIHILLDPTRSMGADGKWDYARQLSIALGHIALKSGDTVSFSTWSDGQDHFFRRKGAVHRASMTKFISSINEPGVVSDFTDRALRHIPKAVTVLFIITDGLEETGKWAHLFRRLPGICRDIRIVTVHSKQEEAPEYDGDVRFIDIESEAGVEVTVTRRAVQDYLEKKAAHEAKIAALAGKYGIQLLHAEVSEGFMETVTKKMRHAGWVR